MDGLSRPSRTRTKNRIKHNEIANMRDLEKTFLPAGRVEVGGNQTKPRTCESIIRLGHEQMRSKMKTHNPTKRRSLTFEQKRDAEFTRKISQLTGIENRIAFHSDQELYGEVAKGELLLKIKETGIYRAKFSSFRAFLEHYYEGRPWALEETLNVIEDHKRVLDEEEGRHWIFCRGDSSHAKPE